MQRTHEETRRLREAAVLKACFGDDPPTGAFVFSLPGTQGRGPEDLRFILFHGDGGSTTANTHRALVKRYARHVAPTGHEARSHSLRVYEEECLGHGLDAKV